MDTWRDGTMGNRKLGIIMVLSFFLLFSMTGCATEKVVWISPFLPDYSPSRPTRPVLNKVEDGVQLPISALDNLILLQGYAKELEAYADGWERFYERLREKHEETSEK